MERQKFELRELFWVIILQLSVLTMATNVTNDTPEITEEPTIGLYAWSAWGSWSPCSRSCGGGVSVQERQCLPRSRSLVNNETLTSISTDRQTRQAIQDCYGLDKRYHECNTHQCAGGARDMRAVQCSSYDRRPFRGRFYTWTPYIDGDSPCMLNCRPLGQQFYASLALVVDGTPCTKPGYRAICIQGHCKWIKLPRVLKQHPAIHFQPHYLLTSKLAVDILLLL